MANSLLKIDVTKLEGLVEKLGALDESAMSLAVANAINTVADSGYAVARQRMNAGINLTDQYLRAKSFVSYATASNEKATITAVGDVTSLSHYNPVIIPRKGAQPGGVQVTVTRGSNKPVLSQPAFALPGVNDSEGNPLVFQRLGGITSTGKAPLQRLLGPAVYQLFRYQLPTLIPELETQLGEALLASVDQEISKALS